MMRASASDPPPPRPSLKMRLVVSRSPTVLGLIRGFFFHGGLPWGLYSTAQYLMCVRLDA